MGHLFPGGTKPTSGSEFRSRVIFRLMWWLDGNLYPSPLEGEGGAKRRMRGMVAVGLEPPAPSSALRAPSPSRGEG